MACQFAMAEEIEFFDPHFHIWDLEADRSGHDGKLLKKSNAVKDGEEFYGFKRYAPTNLRMNFW